jgi:predicted enzyme related to lactoylglutathione lyase
VDRPYPWLLEFFFESVEDLSAKVDELVGAGYRLIDAPYMTAFGMWFAFVEDPDGNTVLLSAQRDEPDL